MKLSLSDNKVTLSLSFSEAAQFLINHIRIGAIHIYSGTVPLSFDIKVTLWNHLWNWANKQGTVITIKEMEFNGPSIDEL
jgi:hypothetical protein